MSAVFQTVRLRPEGKPQVLGEYDVDAVAVELDERGAVIDFRLELGSGLELDWLLPIEPNGRLRLVRIGFVTIDDMDPELLQDPCAPAFAYAWSGELARVGRDRDGVLVELVVTLTDTPAGYRCQAAVRRGDETTTYVLAYAAPA